MTAHLLGLGTANPEHRMSQEEALQMFSDIVCEDDKQRRLARVLFRKSEVANRYTCVPHQVAYNWCQPREDAAEAGGRNLSERPAQTPCVIGGQSSGPSTHERMQLYAEFASDLAIEASRTALTDSATDPQMITHLVTVSCTGFDAPGVDIELIRRLGLPASTQRINVGFMGCHGAINGMRAALGIVGSDPTARVLMCCVELCSLHYRFQWASEGIIGNALFADGSAALVLGQPPAPGQSSPKASGPPNWQLVDTGSLIIPDSKQAMSWRVGDHGFEMLLTSEVGERIEQRLSRLAYAVVERARSCAGRRRAVGRSPWRAKNCGSRAKCIKTRSRIVSDLPVRPAAVRKHVFSHGSFHSRRLRKAAR